MSSNDGNVDVPYGSTYDGNFTFSTAFNAGSLGLQRVGAQAYIGQAPTYYLTSGGSDIAGTGRGNHSFNREAIFALLYFGKFDVSPMFAHGGESAYLANYYETGGVPPVLPAGSRNPAWNNLFIEAHYLPNPQFILTYRYDAIYMTQQVNDTLPSDAGNTVANTIAARYYPFMHSRAGLALHGEFSHLNQKHVFSTTTGTLQDESYYSVFGGLDFIF